MEALLITLFVILAVIILIALAVQDREVNQKMVIQSPIEIQTLANPFPIPDSVATCPICGGLLEIRYAWLADIYDLHGSPHGQTWAVSYACQASPDHDPSDHTNPGWWNATHEILVWVNRENPVDLIKHDFLQRGGK